MLQCSLLVHAAMPGDTINGIQIRLAILLVSPLIKVPIYISFGERISTSTKSVRSRELLEQGQGYSASIFRM
jgi:hypothetical protein